MWYIHYINQHLFLIRVNEHAERSCFSDSLTCVTQCFELKESLRACSVNLLCDLLRNEEESGKNRRASCAHV